MPIYSGAQLDTDILLHIAGASLKSRNTGLKARRNLSGLGYVICHRRVGWLCPFCNFPNFYLVLLLVASCPTKWQHGLSPQLHLGANFAIQALSHVASKAYFPTRVRYGAHLIRIASSGRPATALATAAAAQAIAEQMDCPPIPYHATLT